MRCLIETFSESQRDRNESSPDKEGSRVETEQTCPLCQVAIFPRILALYSEQATLAEKTAVIHLSTFQSQLQSHKPTNRPTDQQTSLNSDHMLYNLVLAS